MHSLCENENIPMWGKRIAPLQKKLLSVLTGSLLKLLLFYLLEVVMELFHSHSGHSWLKKTECGQVGIIPIDLI